MYNCAKIKEMMQLSKMQNESVFSTFNGETIFVKYSEQFDDYTFQYSWNITEKDSRMQQGVHDEVNNILLEKFGYDKTIQKTDVIQIGLISVYNANEKLFIEVIELARQNKLEQTRDTKYVFCGKKVLSVLQYYGKFCNPFYCLDNTNIWSDSIIQKEIENQNLIKIIKGIYIVYYEGKDSIIFSIGCKHKKTVFTDNIDNKIPQLLCIDSIKGITEFNITNNSK